MGRKKKSVCPKCNTRPKMEHRSYCRECLHTYEKFYREKNKAKICEARERFKKNHPEATKQYEVQRLTTHGHDTRRDYQRKWKASHRDAERKYRKKIRKEAIEAYGGVCEFCGETTPEYLEIDHIDKSLVERDSKGRRLSSSSMYALLRRQGWPTINHRLLCCNCNRCREVYGDEIAKNLGSERKMFWDLLDTLLLENTKEKP